MRPIAVAIMLVTGMSCLATEPALGSRLIEPFNYHGVTLNDSLLRQTLEVRDDYLRVPNDDYLKGFRRAAQTAGRRAR